MGGAVGWDGVVGCDGTAIISCIFRCTVVDDDRDHIYEAGNQSHRHPPPPAVQKIPAVRVTSTRAEDSSSSGRTDPPINPERAATHLSRRTAGWYFCDEI